MSKDLADRDQAGAVAQQLPGERMTQAMWTHSWQPGSRAGPLDDITD